MPTRKQTTDKHAKRRLILDRIYDLLDVGVEARELSAAMFADDNISAHTVGDYTREMDKAGILRRRMEYGTPKNGLRTGRHFHWTLLVPKRRAIEILDVLDATEIANIDRARRKAGKKAAQTRKNGIDKAIRVVDDEPVEAIIGPDAPNQFEVLRPYRRVVAEPYALVEAARQYANRTNTMSSKIDALLAQARELGMTVDEATLRGSVVFDSDDRLDVVVLVLPYIDQLEAATARLIGQVEGLKEQITELNKARMEITALRGQNERLIAKIAQAH